jgi:hypothetical protein
LTSTVTSVRVVHTATCPEIGPICAERDEPPQLHDQRFNIGEVRLSAAYGLWRWLGVEAQLPLRLNHTTVEYTRLDGSAFEPDYEQIHHRDETLVGPGDPWLLARGDFRVGTIALVAKMGASLPVGSTEENPFALGDMGLPHQHIQFGAGTVAPIAALSSSMPLGPSWRAMAHAQAQLFVASNHHGYRPGNRFTAGLSGGRSFGAFTGLLGLEVATERSERWNGEVLQDGNLGRTDLLAGAVASYRLGGVSLGLGVKVPVYQDIVTAGDEHGQLSYPAIVELSVERAFDLSP